MTPTQTTPTIAQYNSHLRHLRAALANAQATGRAAYADLVARDLCIHTHQTRAAVIRAAAALQGVR